MYEVLCGKAGAGICDGANAFIRGFIFIREDKAQGRRKRREKGWQARMDAQQRQRRLLLFFVCLCIIISSSFSDRLEGKFLLTVSGIKYTSLCAKILCLFISCIKCKPELALVPLEFPVKLPSRQETISAMCFVSSISFELSAARSIV